MPILDQFACPRRVDLPALSLPVGSVRAADIRALIIVQAKPVQAIHDLLLRARHGSLNVRILDAQNELPAGLAGKQVIIQGGPGGSQVHMTGG